MGCIAVIINALVNLDMHHAKVIAKVIRKGQKVQNQSTNKKNNYVHLNAIYSGQIGAKQMNSSGTAYLLMYLVINTA